MKRISEPMHPEVTEVALGGRSFTYLASEKEQRNFEGLVGSHEPLITTVSSACGFSDSTIACEHREGVSSLCFRGRQWGRAFLFTVESVVHPVRALGDEGSTALLVVDLLIKIRSAADMNGPEGPRLNLYWVGDERAEDDWFVVARAAADARRFYSNHFGDDSASRSKYTCRMVCRLPSDFQKVDDEVFNEYDRRASGWPTHDTIRACGGSFRKEEQPRVVVIGERVFTEGMLDAIVERGLRGRRPDPQ